MRNGNSVTPFPLSNDLLSSYRTYEEWKRIITDAEGRTFQSSYRTYEEWKPNAVWICRKWNWVLTVPMRNGNHQLNPSPKPGPPEFLPYLWGMETPVKQRREDIAQKSSYRTYEEWKLPIFMKCFYTVHQFLPYLWGMETCYESEFGSGCCGFLPYLWGMETQYLT